jgi:amino acid transporter
MADGASPTKLRRSLGPLEVAFLAFSAASPAASVYLYGAGVIQIGGSGAVLAIAIGAPIAAVLGLLFGEIAAAFPEAGGVYPGFVKVLGERLAFPYVILMLLISVTASAFVLLGLADYVRLLWPGLPELPVAWTALVAATILAVLGIRLGAKITGAFLIVELLALAAVTACAFITPWSAALSSVMHPFIIDQGHRAPLPATSFGLAVVTALFTCGGATWVLYFGEEMVDAHRKIGTVINWVSPLAAVLIGVPIVLAVLASPNREAMLASATPIADFLRQTGGPRLALVVSFGIALAVFNAVVAMLMSYGRFIYSTARDGMWPRVLGAPLGAIWGLTGSPMIATVVLAVIAGLAMFLGQTLLIVLSANENVLEYLLLGLAVIIGRRKGMTGAHHKVWPYPALAIFAIVVAFGLVVADWLDPVAGRPSLIVLLAVVVFSYLYHPLVLKRRGKAEPTLKTETPSRP